MSGELIERFRRLADGRSKMRGQDDVIYEIHVGAPGHAWIASSDLTAAADELTTLRAQVSQLTADLEVACGALEDGMGQLHWINAQAVNIMDSTNHIYVTNEDSAVARMMIDSMASDIGVNAMMLNDKLSATLNTIRKDG